MANIIVISLACLAIGSIYMKYSACKKNYSVAKSSGLPVFYSPVHVTDWWWLMLYTLFVPFLKLLPASWKTPWLPMAQLWSIWKVGHQPFEDAGSDTFLLASPGGNMLWTCDPSVVKQLFVQHAKVQVPVDMVKFYDFWGPTIGSVEGEEWKTNRRVVAAGFNPATNSAVWKEATQQTQSLIDRWVEDGSIIPVVKRWTSRLALHVISGVFFNKNLEWKEYTHESEPGPPGHLISYEKALFTVLARLGTIFMTPRPLLSILPFKFFKEAHVAFTEWTKYMLELRESIVSRIEEVANKKNKSLLESIVVAGTPGPTQPVDRPLKEENTLGNIFFTLFAGHETTGNTMAFILLLLSIYPEYQKQVQRELDAQLGDRPKEEWTAEQDYQTFQRGYIGAVQKEVLRLYCVVQFLLRTTVAPTSVTDSKGQTHIIPKDTLCLLDFAAAFKNPNTWTQRDVSPERRAELNDSPALYFDPSRWLNSSESMENEEINGPIFWPFGQGPRSCVGRGFAQQEMTAVIATIFKDYSLELVVDDQTIQACKGNSKLAWEKTRDKALKMMIDDVEANINIQMLKELPIRIVKRSG